MLEKCLNKRNGEGKKKTSDLKHYLPENCCTYGCGIMESEHSELVLAYAFSCIMQKSTEGACGPSDQNGFAKKAQTLITAF